MSHHLAFCLLCPLWSVDISDIPYLMTFDSFEEPGTVRMSLKLLFFSWLVWGFYAWEDNRRRVSSSPIRSICHQTDDADLSEAVCASFLTAVAFGPFPYFILLDVNHEVQPTFRVLRHTTLRGNIYINYGILPRSCLTSHLFIYSIIYIACTIDVYFILWISIQS